MSPPVLILILIGLGLGASRSPNVESIADTAWRATDNGSQYKEYTFRPDGSISFWNRNTYFKSIGAWKQNGKVIHLEVNNGYAEYNGSVEENNMALSARNIEGTEWSESLQRTVQSCGAVGAIALQAYLGMAIESVKTTIGRSPLDITWGEERHFAWDSRKSAQYEDRPTCVLKLQVDSEGIVVDSDIQGHPCSCASFVTETAP